MATQLKASKLMRLVLTPLQCAQIKQLAKREGVSQRNIFSKMLCAYLDKVECLDLSRAQVLHQKLIVSKRIWTQFFAVHLTLEESERVKAQADRLGMNMTKLCSSAVTYYFLQHPDAPAADQVEIAMALELEHGHASAYVAREQLAYGELACRCLKLGFAHALAGDLPSLELEALDMQEALVVAAPGMAKKRRHDVKLPWALCEELLAWAGRQNLQPERVIQRLFEHGFALLLGSENAPLIKPQPTTKLRGSR